MTRTVVRLPISQAAFSEIAGLLKAAGYDHAFMPGAINMHGIAIEPDPNKVMPPGVVEIDPTDISREAFRRIYQLDTKDSEQ